ncbi:hypothetical protein [Paenibacillus alvei]|uniref:hypothetical protein n=1 Tax=Paenibacillus alvei TaxID=44250 RepID=UPI0018CEABC2|nr:hypothetical protein [Paenibacillus alvei]MBG9733293.1 hypothetical protein [Paenibacillus alvei]MBG9745148.1 hypothetical protein [Paenibacillus alvei]MCY9580718.1 hypothetical protein [Paenibacillus alvei]MCY9585201.1 hypothetical protein [Paenibacillus alvei]
MAKEVWEINAEERLMRLLKVIPSICMNDEVVKSVSNIPINKRVHFEIGVDLLLERLLLHHRWWKQIKAELNKKPDIRLVNDNTALTLDFPSLCPSTICQDDELNYAKNN